MADAFADYMRLNSLVLGDIPMELEWHEMFDPIDTMWPEASYVLATSNFDMLADACQIMDRAVARFGKEIKKRKLENLLQIVLKNKSARRKAGFTGGRGFKRNLEKSAEALDAPPAASGITVNVSKGTDPSVSDE